MLFRSVSQSRYQWKGAYKWNKLFSAKQIQHKIDSLATATTDTLDYYKLKSDSLAPYGYTRRDRLASELSKKGSATDVAANTAARHSAVTLGTANGLSLSGQQLSLGLSSTSSTGALSSTDWNTFNSKQSSYTNLTSIGSLTNGSGFLKNNGSGTFSYAFPTFSEIASKPTTLSGYGITDAVQLSPASAQSGNIWVDGAINAQSYTIHQTMIDANNILNESESTNELYGLNLANGPHSDWYAIKQYGIYSGSYGIQLYYPISYFETPDNRSSIWFRQKSGGMFYQYRKIWDSGNLPNPITGTLTSGYIPVATGSGSIGNSQIYTDGQNLTIDQGTSGNTIVTGKQIGRAHV